MDFRVLALSLLLWLVPLWACANEQLDKLTWEVYQYPTKALAQITALEKLQSTDNKNDIDRLRLSILKMKRRLILRKWVKPMLNSLS